MTESGAWQVIKELDQLGVQLECEWHDGKQGLHIYPVYLVPEHLRQQITEHCGDIIRIIGKQEKTDPTTHLVRAALAFGARILKPSDFITGDGRLISKEDIDRALQGK